VKRLASAMQSMNDCLWTLAVLALLDVGDVEHGADLGR